MVILQVQRELKEEHGTSVSVIQATPGNQEHVDFNLVMQSMAEGPGKDLVVEELVGIHLHSKYGCWYGCKFIIVFDEFPCPPKRPSQKAQPGLVAQPEAKSINELLSLGNPMSHL